MRLFSFIQAQAQESSEWGQHPETVTLTIVTTISSRELDIVKSNITALK